MAKNQLNKVTNDSGSGYCKMPDGTLMQWGSTTVQTSGTGGGISGLTNYYEGNVIFPIPFIDSNVFVTADGDNAIYGNVGARLQDNTYFIVSCAHNADVSVEIRWFAIGHWK